jgi:hypothetical protein
MKSVLIKWTSVVWLLCLVVACSKESASNNNSATANTTGANGSLSRFTIQGDYLYAVTNHYLYTYDISDLTNPVRTNTSDISFDIETIYHHNGHLFIGARTGLYIYSISNPSHPVLEGEASHARSCDPVVAIVVRLLAVCMYMISGISSTQH